MAFMPALFITLRVLFVLAICTALLVILQVWLCKRSLKLGLILPCGSFVITLFPTVFIALNMEVRPKNLLALGFFFLVYIIPTIIFGCVWLHYRGRQSIADDLRRMQIEDLE